MEDYDNARTELNEVADKKQYRSCAASWHGIYGTREGDTAGAAAFPAVILRQTVKIRQRAMGTGWHSVILQTDLIGQYLEGISVRDSEMRNQMRCKDLL